MAMPDATPKLDSSAELPQRIDLGEGEELILLLKPHWIFVLIDNPFKLTAAFVASVNGWFFLGGTWGLAALAILPLWIIWQFIERASRTYVLTDRRVVMIAGVLRQAIVDAPLANVRQVSVIRSVPERLLGLGTVAFATAGTGGQDIIWHVLDCPVDTLRTARDTLDAARVKP